MTPHPTPETDEVTDELPGGELPKAWMGIRTQVVTEEVARALGFPELRGFRISQVYPWTEASRAGLEVGDVIVGLAGQALRAARLQESEDLRRAIEERSIGEEIELQVIRGGGERSLRVRLERRPEETEEVRRARQEELEFGVREVTFLDRIRNRWSREQAGVVVTEVTPGGWAQMAGLRIEDLLLAVQERPVESIERFEEVMRRLLAERPRVVKVFLRRGARTHFVFLEPEWKELE